LRWLRRLKTKYPVAIPIARSARAPMTIPATVPPLRPLEPVGKAEESGDDCAPAEAELDADAEGDVADPDDVVVAEEDVRVEERLEVLVALEDVDDDVANGLRLRLILQRTSDAVPLNPG